MDDAAHPNRLLLDRFYCAFNERDWNTMGECYAPSATFTDPVFGRLDAEGARAMWRMLLTRAQDLEIEHHVRVADDTHGEVDWIARYTFGRTGRRVENRVLARFEFSQGRIVRHVDHFDLWAWAGQAFGPLGWMLGWTGFMRCRIRDDAGAQLGRFKTSAAR